MTLDEAIKHCMDIAETQEMCSNGKKCAEEHRQLAEWLKDYKRLLEQQPIIDKIRIEVEQTVSRYTISRERGGMGQVEWSDRLIKESEVMQILDKYKVESEE